MASFRSMAFAFLVLLGCVVSAAAARDDERVAARELQTTWGQTSPICKLWGPGYADPPCEGFSKGQALLVELGDVCKPQCKTGFTQKSGMIRCDYGPTWIDLTMEVDSFNALEIDFTVCEATSLDAKAEVAELEVEIAKVEVEEKKSALQRADAAVPEAKQKRTVAQRELADARADLAEAQAAEEAASAAAAEAAQPMGTA